MAVLACVSFLRTQLYAGAGESVGVCALQGGALLPPTEAVPVPEAYFPLSNYTSSSWPVPEWCAPWFENSTHCNLLQNVLLTPEQRHFQQAFDRVDDSCLCLILAFCKSWHLQGLGPTCSAVQTAHERSHSSACQGQIMPACFDMTQYGPPRVWWMVEKSALLSRRMVGGDRPVRHGCSAAT